MIEFHAWPPRSGGQHTGRVHYGCLAIDKITGAAVMVDSEHSQHANQQLAEQRLQALLAVLPWACEVTADTRPSIAELQAACVRDKFTDEEAIILSAPVLLEIVAAALAVEATEYGTTAWGDARHIYRAALAKVRS